MPVTVGVPRETYEGERRVALTPKSCDALKKLGAEVWLETGAGVESGLPDEQYEAKGVKIASRNQVFESAHVIVQVRSLGANPRAGQADLAQLRPGQVVIGFGEPLSALPEMSELARAGVSFFAMELVPRITRAQSMDALSSMATVAGYWAVLLAAYSLPKMFPMLMTAAGTVAPAKVFVLGAGVAGLQAIATARRLGSVVSAYDVRSAVREQVESVGARFVVLDMQTAEGTGGYAAAMDETYYQRQRELMTAVLREQNVVITTAAVPGRKAPLLVTAAMVEAMTPGSIIVDLAAERGGNCELTRADQVVLHNGVTILGPTNLAARVPFDASQMYGANLVSLLKLLTKKGEWAPDFNDEIVAGTLVTHEGRVIHPAVCERMGLTSEPAI